MMWVVAYIVVSSFVHIAMILVTVLTSKKAKKESKLNAFDQYL